MRLGDFIPVAYNQLMFKYFAGACTDECAEELAQDLMPYFIGFCLIVLTVVCIVGVALYKEARRRKFYNQESLTKSAVKKVTVPWSRLKRGQKRMLIFAACLVLAGAAGFLWYNFEDGRRRSQRHADERECSARVHGKGQEGVLYGGGPCDFRGRPLWWWQKKR